MIFDVPTQLAEQKSIEFRRLCKKHYNIDLTEEESNEEAFRMLTFLSVILEYKTKSL